MVLLHWLIFPLTLWSSEIKICESYAQPKSFLEIKNKIETKVNNFAKAAPVAKKADKVLSQLISAKSPTVFSWLKKQGLMDKSDEQIVKKWREYYGKKLALSQYPHQDKAIDRLIEKLVDSILAENLSTSFRQKAEKLFGQSKKAALKYLQNNKALDPLHKKQALQRLESIKLYWPESLKTARNKNNPQDIISWGIAYDPRNNSINMGIHSLGYPNDETYIAVFAHELGHAIDSCRWGAFLKGAWPFQKVGDCLRTSKSVQAKRRDDSPMDLLVKQGRLSKNDAIGLKQHPTCNRSIFPPPGFQADQLPESFADWFSAEVVAEMENLDFSKLRTDLCSSKKLSDASSYPDNPSRLSKIYYAHPKIRQKSSLKGLSRAIHCAL